MQHVLVGGIQFKLAQRINSARHNIMYVSGNNYVVDKVTANHRCPGGISRSGFLVQYAY